MTENMQELIEAKADAWDEGVRWAAPESDLPVNWQERNPYRAKEQS